MKRVFTVRSIFALTFVASFSIIEASCASGGLCCCVLSCFS